MIWDSGLGCELYPEAVEAIALRYLGSRALGKDDD